MHGSALLQMLSIFKVFLLTSGDPSDSSINLTDRSSS